MPMIFTVRTDGSIVMGRVTAERSSYRWLLDVAVEAPRLFCSREAIKPAVVRAASAWAPECDSGDIPLCIAIEHRVACGCIKWQSFDNHAGRVPLHHTPPDCT